MVFGTLEVLLLYACRLTLGDNIYYQLLYGAAPLISRVTAGQLSWRDSS